MISEIQVEHRLPTVREYQVLRNTTDWNKLSDSMVEKGIEGSLFAVCLILRNQLLGMGRVVGDGSIYFYIQDIIVDPEWRNHGLGAIIMKELMEMIRKSGNLNSFIGLMAAEGTIPFYEKFGFEKRKEVAPGMFMYQST